MAGNRIYLQVDINTGGAQAQIDAINKKIADIGPTTEKATVQATKGVQGLTVSVEQSMRTLDQMGQAIAGLGIIRLGQMMLDAADDINRVQLAFEGMTGSAVEASRIMTSLRAIAKESPFAFQDLAEGAQRLKAFGFEASKIPSMMKTIANTVATLGGGKEKLDTVILGLGKMNLKEIAQGAELFRQLGGAGVQFFPAIQKAIQAQTGQLMSDDQIRKLMQGGKLAGHATAMAILDEMERTMSGGGAKIAALPTSQLTKLADDLRALARQIINDFAPTINAVIKSVRALVDTFEELPPWIRNSIAGLTALAAAVGLVAIAVKGLAVAFEAVQAAQLLGGITKLKAVEEAIVASKIAWEAAEGIGIRAIGSWIMKLKELIPVLAEVHSVAELGLLGLLGVGAAVAGGKLGMWLDEGPGGDMYKAIIATNHAMKDQIGLAEMLRAKTVAKFGIQPPLTKAFSAMSLEEIQAFNTAQLARLQGAKKKGEDIIKASEEEAKHAEEIAQEIWERAQASLYEGVSAIQYKIAGALRQTAGFADAQAKIREAGRIEEQHLVLQYMNKQLDEQDKIDKQILEGRIQTAQKSMEATKAAFEATYAEPGAAQGQLVAKRYQAEVDALKNIQKLKDEAAKADYDRSKRQYEDEGGRQGYPKFAVALAVLNAERTLNEARRKNAEDTDTEIEKRRVELAKQAVDDITRLNEDALNQRRENELNAIRTTAELRKDALSEIPAQTEEAKRQVVLLSAQADLEAAQNYADVQNRIIEEDRVRWGNYYEELLKKQIITKQQYERYADAANAAAEQKAIAATQAGLDERTKIMSAATKQVNEAALEEQKKMFESIKSDIDKVWDVLFDRSQNVFKAMGLALKKALMEGMKEAFSNRAAGALTEAFGGGHVSFEGGWRGLLGRSPVFSGKFTKLEAPGHIGDATTINGALRTYIVNPPQPPPSSPTSTGATSGPSSWDILGPALAASGSWASVAAARGGEAVPAGEVQSSLYGVPQGSPAIFGPSSITGGPGGTGGFIGQVKDIQQTVDSISRATGQGGSGSGSGSTPMSLPSQIKSLWSSLGQALNPSKMALGLGAAGAALGGIGLGIAHHISMRGGTSNALIGAGVGAFSGGLLAGGLTAMFPALAALGPWGIIAGLAAGALFGASGAFSKLPQVRERIRQVYGIDIRQNNILQQIVDIVNSKYGGSIALGVRSPEVQQIVKMYAQATGQSIGGLPRPMYGVTYAQSSAGLQLQPVYSGGQMVASPYSGATTTQWALGSMYVQLDPSLANQLFSGQVINVMQNNPAAVATANSSAVQSGTTRTAQRTAMLEPLTVVS